MRDAAQVVIVAREDRQIVAALFDGLGRRVKLLHSGHASANEPMHLDLPIGELAPGLYFVRVASDEYVLSKSVMVVR